VRLTEAQSRELLGKHGVYVSEVCNTCRKILGHVRLTRSSEPGEWCSRECRDGVQVAERERVSRKGGRPRKYRTDRERRIAERRQNAIRQQAFRQRRSVTENRLANLSFCAITEPENRPLAVGIPDRGIRRSGTHKNEREVLCISDDGRLERSQGTSPFTLGVSDDPKVSRICGKALFLANRF